MLMRSEKVRGILKRAKFRLNFQVQWITFLTNNLSKNMDSVIQTQPVLEFRRISGQCIEKRYFVLYSEKEVDYSSLKKNYNDLYLMIFCCSQLREL